MGTSELFNVIGGVINMSLLVVIVKTLKEARLFVKEEVSEAIKNHNNDENSHPGIRAEIKELQEMHEEVRHWQNVEYPRLRDQSVDRIIKAYDDRK